MTDYAELHCHSFYSLLDGVSSPEALVARAQEVGLHALALTDHDSLAGASRFFVAARRAAFPALFGAEVTLQPLHSEIQSDDAQPSHLTLLAETQTGYGNLCRLISAARLDHLPAPLESWDPTTLASDWPGKIAPLLSWERLAEHSTGLIALTGCPRGVVAAPILKRKPADALNNARRLLDIFGANHLFVEIQHLRLPEGDRLLRHLCALAATLALPIVATGNVHYATRNGARLHDALHAIDANLSLADARRAGLLSGSSMAYLASPHEMAARFAERPDAITNTLRIAERCHGVSLDFSEQRLPAFRDPETDVPVVDGFARLYNLCHDALPHRYPALRANVISQLAHELQVIEQTRLANFFLLVWDVVRFARSQGIRCQGRGSAASSIVAYLLGISSIDPLRHNLLFERFLTADRYTMPDIDLDIAADRREEVIQYVYRRYGRAHAAMVANAVTYRARSAVRDLGKALEIPETVLDRLASRLESSSPSAAADAIAAEVAAEEHAEDHPASHPLLLLADLMRQIDGLPRHLSIHSGGMLITTLPLDQIVPLEPATMPGRVIVQWDKDSCEDAGLVKLDLLGLRTLGLVSEALQISQAMTGKSLPDPDTLTLDDPALYDMLCKGETIGTFQVESRAQAQMSVRLKPRTFEDIAVEVAIVRPGPIQGGAVHPYLRRRNREEPVTYLHPCLEPVLAETLGVLLYQEQSIRVAVAAAGFTPAEADMLRRALSRSRSDDAMQQMEQRFLRGAAEKGIDEPTAWEIYRQLQGFAGFGFCKSHATSFALIAYQTLWLKKYHAVAFYCALLNQQPMGFYTPEVIVGDARRHGVDVLPPDVQNSVWNYAPEQQPNRRWALRMGLSTVSGVGDTAWRQIETARANASFSDLPDLVQRTRLDRDLIASLIRGGACDRFGQRRTLLWQLGEIEVLPNALSIVATPIDAPLPRLQPLEQAGWEHELLGLEPRGQVMRHYRATLKAQRILGTWEVKQTRQGAWVRTAGLIAISQRPATAGGIVFISLEDESGLVDLVVKPEVWRRYRDVLRGSMLIVAEGEVQRTGRAVSVLVRSAVSLLELLGSGEEIARVGRSWF